MSGRERGVTYRTRRRESAAAIGVGHMARRGAAMGKESTGTEGGSGGARPERRSWRGAARGDWDAAAALGWGWVMMSWPGTAGRPRPPVWLVGEERRGEERPDWAGSIGLLCGPILLVLTMRNVGFLMNHYYGVMTRVSF